MLHTHATHTHTHTHTHAHMIHICVFCVPPVHNIISVRDSTMTCRIITPKKKETEAEERRKEKRACRTQKTRDKDAARDVIHLVT